MPIERHKLDLDFSLKEERLLAKKIRKDIYNFIEQKNISKKELEKKFQLSPMGIYNLFNKEWSLPTAIRIAILLKMKVLISINNNGIMDVN